MPRKECKPDASKLLMIKTKACQRLIRESKYYEDEVILNEQKLQQMKDENRDPYDIKKFQEVLSESHMMIPDSICRRDKALADLNHFLAALENEREMSNDLNGSEWMLEAKKILKESGLAAVNSKEEAGGEMVETFVDDLKEGEVF
eukprot:CCRYP_013476-RA/>CCRYP_013476-RA protein AED:0.04 eAED:0.04 QI:193/1/1/1/1/1/2/1488/145